MAFLLGRCKFLCSTTSFSLTFLVARSLSLQMSRITTVRPIWMPCWFLVPIYTFRLSSFTRVPNLDLLS